MKENYNFGENLKYVPIQKRWQLINIIKNYLTLEVQDEYLEHLPHLFCIQESSFLQQGQEFNQVTETWPLLSGGNGYCTPSQKAFTLHLNYLLQSHSLILLFEKKPMVLSGYRFYFHQC